MEITMPNYDDVLIMRDTLVSRIDRMLWDLDDETDINLRAGIGGEVDDAMAHLVKVEAWLKQHLP